MQLLVDIYRNPSKEGMYLYVEKGANLEKLPELLHKQFSRKELVMTLLLNPEKKLARAEAGKVIEVVKEQGFYLQMPPGPNDYMPQNSQAESGVDKL